MTAPLLVQLNGRDAVSAGNAALAPRLLTYPAEHLLQAVLRDLVRNAIKNAS